MKVRITVRPRSLMTEFFFEAEIKTEDLEGAGIEYRKAMIESRVWAAVQRSLEVTWKETP